MLTWEGKRNQRLHNMQLAINLTCANDRDLVIPQSSGSC